MPVSWATTPCVAAREPKSPPPNHKEFIADAVVTISFFIFLIEVATGSTGQRYHKRRVVHEEGRYTSHWCTSSWHFVIAGRPGGSMVNLEHH